MSCKKILVLTFLSFLFCTCNNSSEFYYTKSGIKYKFHDIVIEGKNPQKSDYLNVFIDWLTLSDSIIYSSKNRCLLGVHNIKLSENNNRSIEEVFYKLKKGDSLSIYINSEEFFKNYLNLPLPDEINKKEDIILRLRLLNISSENQQIKYKDSLIQRARDNEDLIINNIVKKWESEYDSVITLNNELVIVPITSLDTFKIIKGDRVKLIYSAMLVNGFVFYKVDSLNVLEFVIGEEGQMLEGFKDILLTLSKGSKVMALSPSNLAFGKKGSSDGSIPPYSPLIYNIEIVEVIKNLDSNLITNKKSQSFQ